MKPADLRAFAAGVGVSDWRSACVLLPPESHMAGRCGWCAGVLTGRRRAWCREDCRLAFLRNHYWAWARAEALRRARLGPRGQWVTLCDGCGRATYLEVNHVDPRVGQGYGEGCHHHQTNLQPLCHECHVAETTRQRRERAGRPAPPVQEALWAVA